MSDKSKELLLNYINSFMDDIKDEMEIIGASYCQLHINYNKDLDPVISCEIEISKKEKFNVENGKIIQ